MLKKSLSKSTLMTALITGSVIWGGYTVGHAEEQQAFFLDEMVVTATRTPVEAFKANANISVITKKEIEERHYQDLSEALRMVPGVYIGNYSVAGYDNSNNLKINGADEIVVLVDGVKINNVNNKISAVMLKNLDNVERIEVLKGSASTLYGSDAKGGVINIITAKPEGIKTKISAELGSFNTENYAINHQGKEKDWSWDAYVSKNKISDFKDGRGVTTPAYSNATSTSFKITKKLGEKHDLTATYDSYKADYKYTALWEPSLKPGSVDNSNYKFILNSKFDDTTTNQLSFINLDYDTNFNAYLTKVRTMRISDQFTKNFDDKHIVSAGFEYSHDKVITANGVKLINKAVYIQDQFNITDQLKLTAGVRHDKNSGFGDHTTPSVNLGYNFNNDKTNVYVSYSEYFIPPTPTHLYSSKYGNPNIKPETGATKEIGINHRFDDTLVASAHMFWRNSKDRIGYVAPKYTNVGDEKARGWDMQLRKQFNKNISTFVGYTHTIVDATAQRAANVDGYVPKGAWNIGVDYDEGKFSASLLGKGIIVRPGPQTADAVDNFFPATTYWVWDLGLNYKVSKTIKAYVKVNNIFDKFYAEHSNARYNWSSDPDEQWWSAPGRNFLVGMEYTF